MSGPFQVQWFLQLASRRAPRSLFAASCWEGLLAPEKEQAAVFFHCFSNPKNLLLKLDHLRGVNLKRPTYQDLVADPSKNSIFDPPFWACLHCIWISPDRPADSSWSPFCNFQGSVFWAFFHLSDNKKAQRKETNSLPKFNSSPLKSYRAPIGKDCLPFPAFFSGFFAVKLWWCRCKCLGCQLICFHQQVIQLW